MGGFTFWILLALTTILACLNAEAAMLRTDSQAQVYIVTLAGSKHDSPLHLLESVLETSKPTDSLIYIYDGFKAFAARLNIREAHKLTKTPGVVSVIPSRRYQFDEPYSGPFSKGGKLGLVGGHTSDDEAEEPSPSEYWPDAENIFFLEN